ncbi:CRISPR-associated endonuclease Cas3'' [Salarchaeum sp. III]|uniref:CRISPR-associated endonuclease Cas3'' n=1 Tax=Salarchaeum sp. III TaxID=3107927 RepID=UPI002ED83DF2
MQLEKFAARPGQSLSVHLEGVSSAAQNLVTASTTPTGESWQAVLRTLGWTHDFGKLTSYFQTYLETDTRTHAPWSELTYHGDIGAIVTLQALKEQGFSEKTALAGFFAVAKHHSCLPNLRPGVQKYTQGEAAENRIETVEKQFKDIDDNASAAATHVLQQASDGQLSWGDIRHSPEYTQTLLKAVERIASQDGFYGYVLRVWATLVTADKFDASDITSADTAGSLRDTPKLSVETLTQHVQELSKTPLESGGTAARYLSTPEAALPGEDASREERFAAIRTAANARATKTLTEEFQTGTRVFNLSLPTGFGKTLCGLRAALSLAGDRDSRVIYALPYTSIIDQVDQTVQDIFDIPPSSPKYTKHHHLADTRTNLSDSPVGAEYSTGRETLHAESWRAGLVLTTFTQLFESLAGPQNTQSLKLPALEDSVIIIDEPQAVTPNWWPLIGRLTTYLVEEYDATVILMTATQPRILARHADAPTPTPLLELDTETTSLLADYPRVTFSLHPSLTTHLNSHSARPLALSDAAAELTTPTRDGENTLAIVNTVDSVASLVEHTTTDHTTNITSKLLDYQDTPDDFDSAGYLEHLAEHTDNSNRLIAPLTTRLRPIDRSRILTCLKLILDTETQTPFDDIPTLTLSTQLIEAGVDLSFDRLYRDYAPLPALVQAAGRCNRSFGDTPSMATVWRLENPSESEYTPSELIYESRLRPTQAVLASLQSEFGDEIPEAELVESTTEYYDRFHDQRQSEHLEDDLEDAFISGRGEELRKASLIEQSYSTQDILILPNDGVYTQYQAYQQLRDNREWTRARGEFQDLKQHLVSVPTTNPSDDVLVLTPQECESNYDIETGAGPSLPATQSNSEL